MSKKSIIIISIIALVLITAGVVTTLWLTLGKNTGPTNSAQVGFTPDESEDYGACTMLTKAQISSALGSVASNLRDGFNSGKVFYSNDVKAQYCSYNFTDDIADGDFKTEVILHGSQTDATAAARLLDDDTAFKKVSLSGKDGFYRSYTDKKSPEATEMTHFTLTYFTGASQYSLTITQPKDSTDFNNTSATQALTQLANQVSTDN